MYSLVTAKSTVIVCQKKLAKKNESHLVFPSQLDRRWLENHKSPMLDKSFRWDEWLWFGIVPALAPYLFLYI